MNFLKFGRLAMRGIAHTTVPTTSEVEYYSHLLGFSPDRITYSPLGWYDQALMSDASKNQMGHYIFAGGRTSRDYKTLFEAASCLDVQLIVDACKFNVQGFCPPNVTVNDFMPLPEYYAVMAGAQFVVVSLQDTLHAAGLGHIIQAMSAGKAMVATRTPSTMDYIENGQTGLLVEPHNVQEMRSAIAYLLAHPEEAKIMGQKARRRYEEVYTFTAFAERTYAILQKVARSD